jgi:mRNA-degrading endonuclease RelE of RelBE toxin-antitoxin system
MTSPFSDVEITHEFERDLKKLQKRYRTLEEDIETLISTSLYAFHKLEIDTGGIFRLPGLGFEEPPVYKVKKFACRSLKGTGSQSGLRLIYSYSSEADRVVLIELYYKGDKDNEDRARIKRLYGGS